MTHVLDEDRGRGSPRRDPARGQAPVGELLGVHPDSPDPRPIRRPPRPPRRSDRRDRRSMRRPGSDIDRGQLRAREGEMVVRVDEARHDQSPLDVERLGGRRHRADRGIAADGHDALADIATPPANAGSPARAVKTRPLTRTSPRIEPSSHRPTVPAAGSALHRRSTMQRSGWRTRLGARAFPGGGFEHASLANSHRVPRVERDRHRL